MEITYRYTIHPAQQDGKLLLEFIDLPENKDFSKDLVKAFSEINFEITDTLDIWQNDEIVMNAVSVIGNFRILRNVAGYYFIAGDDDKAVIKLDAILSGNNEFLKV